MSIREIWRIPKKVYATPTLRNTALEELKNLKLSNFKMSPRIEKHVDNVAPITVITVILSI